MAWAEISRFNLIVDAIWMKIGANSALCFIPAATF